MAGSSPFAQVQQYSRPSSLHTKLRRLKRAGGHQIPGARRHTHQKSRLAESLAIRLIARSYCITRELPPEFGGLLEDDSRLRALITAGLQESGHRVEEAATAMEGLNLAASASFDALILDVTLQNGEDAGFQVAQRLREDGNSTPILFLTARADVESRLTGLEVGGDDYLSKPFDLRELRARLSALVRRSVGQASNVVLLSLPRSCVLPVTPLRNY